MKTIEPYTPIQYVVGSSEFFGFDFIVDQRVLIPRPETEYLVQAVIDLSKKADYFRRPLRILDLCTGSGNIAISLTKHITNCKIIASDISEAALDVAIANAIQHKVSDRIEFVTSDLFDKIDGLFDIIVSNPPYIDKAEFDRLDMEVLMEPHLALSGGVDGLDFYRKIISGLPKYLARPGCLAMEIGYGQAKPISEIISQKHGLSLSGIRKDQNGIDRVLTAKWINY